MARMTEEEANALDEEITNADITHTQVRQRGNFYPSTGTPLQILCEMVHEKIVHA